MSWTIDFICFLLLTAINGTVMLLVWWAGGRMLDTENGGSMRYRFLISTVAAFLLPVVPTGLYFADLVFGTWGGFLFIPTPLLWRCAAWLFGVWLTGALILTGKYIFAYIRLRLILDGLFPADIRERQKLSEISADMGGAGRRVRLALSYRVTVPLLSGIVHPVVILPVKSYSDDELELILIHELTHVKQRTNLVKLAAVAASVLHWYHPLAQKLPDMVTRWAEYSCDEEAGAVMGNRRKYYTILACMTEGTAVVGSCFVSMLRKKEGDIMDRIERAESLNRNRRDGRQGLKSLVILSAAVLALTAGSGAAFAEGYTALREMTEESMEIAQEWPEVCRSAGIADGIVTEDDADTRSEGERAMNVVPSQLNWTVGNNVHKRSIQFYVQEGQTVIIAGNITPADRTVRAGIEDVYGAMTYSNVSGSFYAAFPVTAGGYYRIFMENSSGTSVTAQLQVLVF